MSVTAFLILLFGTCAIVVFIWWVMFKALTSRKSIHKGPVENAAKARFQTLHNPSAKDHADDHFDNWREDLHQETASQAEWTETESLPNAHNQLSQTLEDSLPSIPEDSGSSSAEENEK